MKRRELLCRKWQPVKPQGHASTSLSAGKPLSGLMQIIRINNKDLQDARMLSFNIY